jgi:hypothetical protein
MSHRSKRPVPPWRGGAEHHPARLQVSRCGCRSPSVAYYRVPFRAHGKSCYHVVAVCLTCHRNAVGSGFWVPREAVHEPEKLPLRPSWMPKG